MSKWAIFCLFFCVLLITAVFCFNNQVLADVNDPSAAPPEKNTPAFLNISAEYQVKRGALRLGTDDVTPPFNYQLEVAGEGADVSNAVIDNNLTVSDTESGTKETLIVDSANNKVCIGECLNISNSKLEISGRGVIIDNNVGNTDNALSVYSYDQEAIFGSGISGGIYSIASGDNNAIYGLSTTGIAVEGYNSQQTYSSVTGFSEDGIAIYGTNLNLLGLWSAYFDGRVESNSDISASKFIANNQSNSLVPFTYGQVADSFDFGNSKILYHDGTYAWLAQDDKILKIRASDGLKVFESTVGNNIFSVIYDDQYYWAVYNSGVAKIDPEDGDILCSMTLSDPKGIAYTGWDYWITVNGDGSLVNINDTCNQVGSAIDLVDQSENTLGKIIYNGIFLWALSTTNDTGSGSVINMNPSTGDAMRWDGLVGSYPVDIHYDNYYYWVLNSGQGTISRFYLQNNKVCTELDAYNSPISCKDDSGCVEFGVCGFVIPQNYGTYLISTDDSHIENNPTNFVFDDNNIWINNKWLDSDSNEYSEIVKMPLADPEEIENIELNASSTAIAFDQSYLWVSSSDSDLLKIYSGNGYGKIDMTNTLIIQNNDTLIPQQGSFDIDGDAKINADVPLVWGLATICAPTDIL